MTPTPLLGAGLILGGLVLAVVGGLPGLVIGAVVVFAGVVMLIGALLRRGRT